MDICPNETLLSTPAAHPLVLCACVYGCAVYAVWCAMLFCDVLRHCVCVLCAAALCVCCVLCVLCAILFMSALMIEGNSGRG